MRPALRIVPCDIKAAREFVAMHHRTHAKLGAVYRFAVGLALDDELVGVALIANPVSSGLCDGLTLEVSRTCLAGEVPNGNSMLYGAAWRAAKALGYRRLVTYTQGDESGASLRGAGWRVIAERRPRPGWDMPSRRRVSHGNDNIPRTLWEAS